MGKDTVSPTDDPADQLIAGMHGRDSKNSQFDYIIVGSGAGGGPLACRLALADKKVLLIEAGQDPAKVKYAKTPGFDPQEGEVHKIPGYHAAATEDTEMSWQFSVRHYEKDADQEKDGKYDPRRDPSHPSYNKFVWPDGNLKDYEPPLPGAPLSVQGKQNKGGIFYPRSSGIGGCTGHHAMIVVRPNDRDWEHIADVTGDDSWRASNMRAYFAKFERCLYVQEYREFLGGILGPISWFFQWLARIQNPRAVLDTGGHGDKGWQPTSFVSPKVLKRIFTMDKGLAKVLLTTMLEVADQTVRLFGWAKRLAVQFGSVRPFDPNDTGTRRDSPEGAFFIPTGIESGGAVDENGRPLFGRRVGVREFILRTRKEKPGNLVVASGVFVKCVLFEAAKNAGEAPRAIGVLCDRGNHLYTASPLSGNSAADEKDLRYFTREGGEVILCGGAFNTPQLLMLSGIGDKTELAKFNIKGPRDKDGKELSEVVHLTGVGKNLQDRYEVAVISEMDADFLTLEGVTFAPGDKNDPARSEWVQDRSGLYASNGGTLAMIRRSDAADGPEPDLFTFGVPAAFRGYYWDWSKELFRSVKRPNDRTGPDLREQQRNLWSWVILKAYTRNNGGSVRLRSLEAFDTPEICFHSFDEGAVKDWEKDVEALIQAVRDARVINAKAHKRRPALFVREIQPGPDLPDCGNGKPDHNSPLGQWIKDEAWGHHACGTCRMGSDPWQSDVAKLRDEKAVLDSEFRVHGVKGLRVVDASVFPEIPGYFILAPILMISEKAADALLAESVDTVYPAIFRAEEAKAIRERRKKARPHEQISMTRENNLPGKTVGLALSGGGIRSATFALGVLQALAEKNRLRDIDFLSTVSGGGFIGSFLGRLFTRENVKMAGDPCERVQETLKDTRSAPLQWLRTQANYIFATGTSDLRLNLAVLWRNIVSVYLVLGAVLFTTFGLLAWLPHGVAILLDRSGAMQLHQLLWPHFAPPVVCGLTLSVWWWLPVLALGLAVLPATLGYWLAPRVDSYRPYPFFSLIAWVVLLTGSLIAFKIPHGMLYAAGINLVLVLAWLWQEATRLGTIRGRETEDARRHVGAIVRNRVVRSIGEALFIFFALTAWVVLDTFAILFAQKGAGRGLAVAAAALAPLLPFLQKIAMSAKQQVSTGEGKGFSLKNLASVLGIPLAIFLLFAIDVFAHKLFITYPGWGWGVFVILVTLAFSLAIGRAFEFLNLSSLQATYASRLVRTFQGASNEERVYAATSSDGHDVGIAHPKDDIPWHEYHPEQQGGPLHLINVCINETVDAASARDIRERKGLPMCVTPHGVSVGRKYFALWAKPDSLPRWQRFRRWLAGVDGDDAQPFLPRFGKQLIKRSEPPLTALQALPVSNDPYAFHVLKTKRSESAEVDSLTLGEWTGISGAAFSTGVGRDTRLSLALFMGLTNVRLGYWWDSGIRYEERPERYPQPLWRRLKRLPITLFRAQSMLLAEWRARFHGPSRWFWYLSDGGHFDVTGLYELLRRRVPFIVLSDAGADPKYHWGDVALLMQEAREDFGAEITWIQPARRDEKMAEGTTGENERANGWQRIFRALPDNVKRPDKWILNWIEPASLGALKDISDRKTPYHAALARVTYDGIDEVSWVLVLKPSLSNDLTEDIINYGALDKSFPQQPTFDQIFDDIQWESYRALGEQIGRKVIQPA